MWSEMHEQADVVRRIVTVNGDRAEHFTEMLAADVRYAVIAARGSSDNAARYAKYVLGIRNRLSVGLAAPSLFGPYGAAPSLEGSLVIGMSQSGQSPDVVEVVKEARRQSRPSVGFTNDVNSPLAAAVELVIDLSAGPEQAIAATKSYSAELAAVARCSVGSDGNGVVALEAIPDVIDHVLARVDSIGRAAEDLIDADHCVVLGRGYHHATAFEWALKLQELTYILAQPFSAADFLHGPIAMIERDFPVLIVATRGPLFEPMADLARDLRRRGAHVVALVDDGGFPADRRIEIPAVEEWLAPLVAAPALQAFAHALALGKGLDPDRPRGLQKVTRTR
jgi:glucosamine--fructose-6-phosphate aminotransferase (isomerizing)